MRLTLMLLACLFAYYLVAEADRAWGPIIAVIVFCPVMMGLILTGQFLHHGWRWLRGWRP